MLSELVKDGKKAREFFDNAVTTSDRVEQINLTELEIAELQAQITEKEENIKITQQKLANQIARDS
jgi:hypothetical protein